MKAKKAKSKKGPKGKRARAKAKLEQVWGEGVDEEARKASRRRAGKSRLCRDDEGGGGQQSKKGAEEDADPPSSGRKEATSAFAKFLERKESLSRRGAQSNDGVMGREGRFSRKNQRGYDSSDDSSDDGSDDEMNGTNGGSYAAFMKRIGAGPKKSRSAMAVDSDDSVERDGDGAESVGSGSSSGESEEGSDDADMQNSDVEEEDSEGSDDADVQNSDVEEEEEDDASAESDGCEQNEKNGLKEMRAAAGADNASEDPYEAHFSKPPLPQPDVRKSMPIVPLLGNKHKVCTARLLPSYMEVQMSGPLLDNWNEVARNAGVDENAPGAIKGNPRSRRAWEEFASGPYRHTRQVLRRNWERANRSALLKRHGKAGKQEEGSGSNDDDGGARNMFSPLQLVLSPSVSRYADVLISSETTKNRDEISNLLSMHVLNHVLTSRARVQRHNRRIKELANNSGDNNFTSDELAGEEGDGKWRDQGYTRPKVLILLPTRGTCWTFVKKMIHLLGNAAMVNNEERFDEEYGPIELDGQDRNADEEEVEDEAKKARRAAVLKQKGAEWNDLFGDSVNADDDFKIGMSLTPNAVVKKSAGKKKSGSAAASAGKSSGGVNVKLFSEFYRSDIILASPIGLKMVLATGEDGGEDGGDDDQESQADADFLTSIDICLVARSDVLLMQNWDHVNGVLDSVNKQPKSITDIDFSRVRNYFLEGQGAHWRQLILVSHFTDPCIISTFRRHAKNVEGQLRVGRRVPADHASICDVVVPRLRQVFQRVACQSFAEAGSDQLHYFAERVLPKLMKLKQSHTLIYVPSYFNFIVLRNLLLRREADFVSVTEYSRISEVSRGRARFLQGRKAMMLYTGRAHFFLRHKIKGARHVIFYGLPEYTEFYPAVVNMLCDGPSGTGGDGIDDDVNMSYTSISCLALFTKFDAHQLERIVGTSHAGRMVKGEKSSYMFHS